MDAIPRVQFKTLLVLTYISLALSCLIIGTSIGTGVMPIWTLVVSVATAIFHIVILSVQYCSCCCRNRRRQRGMDDQVGGIRRFAGTTNGGLVWAFLLVQFWMISELGLLQGADVISGNRLNRLSGVGILVTFCLNTIAMSMMVGLAVTSVIYRCEVQVQVTRAESILS
jgi:hypothetical protein